MDADLKKLKKLTKFMQREGVLVVKTPEIEIQLSPQAVFHEETPLSQENTLAAPEVSPPQYSEMDTLLWSAPGFLDSEGGDGNAQDHS